MDAQAIRRRLVELDDLLRALPADAFADKHTLLVERDECRNLLRDLLGDELTDASDEWAVRAGRKADRSTIESEQRGAARIVSPIEGGSGAH